MAVVTPLYVNADGDLQEMSTAMITAIKDRCRRLYGENPSVTMSVVASAGTLAAINDTRLQAGAASTSTGNQDAVDDGALEYPQESVTAEPSVVTVTYDKMSLATSSPGNPTDTDSIAFPVYYNASGEIQAMTLTDMRDTFILPAIDTLTDGSDQPGTYRIYNASTGLTNHTLVSATPVFVDTRADTTLYSAAGIPETLDQPTTIANYYLWKGDAALVADNTTYQRPCNIRNVSASPDQITIQEYTLAEFDAILDSMVRTAASATAGTRIRYEINEATGNNKGTAMTDTRLNGSGNYQTLFVGVDDYRAQEFPNGSAVTISTYNLRIYQV